MTGYHHRRLMALFVPALLSLAIIGCASDPYKSARGERLNVRATAYTHTQADHLPYGRKSAAGNRLSHGKIKSAGADWSRFPLGTTFRLVKTGDIYRIDDYGSALVGTDTVDLYKPNKRQLRQWGARHVDIEILEWGCTETSLRIMRPRTRFRHVRQMVEAIENGEPAANGQIWRRM